jgi:hypothetical protein
MQLTQPVPRSEAHWPAERGGAAMQPESLGPLLELSLSLDNQIHNIDLFRLGGFFF